MMETSEEEESANNSTLQAEQEFRSKNEVRADTYSNSINLINTQIPNTTSRLGVDHDNIRYTIADTAPYRIYVELHNNETREKKINKFTLGSMIRKMEGIGGHIIDMKYVGQFKIIILLNSFIKANQLVEKINSSKDTYKAYIAKHLISITGVISGIPADITEQEIVNNLESEVPILEVKRMFRYDGENKIPLNRIRIIFRANQLPDRVKLLCCATKVMPFNRKIEICGKCLRYGHRIANCKGSRRCQRCGIRHEHENEYESCLKPMKCVNCKSDEHETTASICPERKRQENINSLRAKQNLTYIEAREQCPYLGQNIYEPLSNLQEFPLLADTFAETTKSVKETLREQWTKTNLPRKPITAAVKQTNTSSQTSQATRNIKRQRVENDTAIMNGNIQKNKSAVNTGDNNKFTGNQYKTNEKERIETLITEAKRKTLETANIEFQEKIMTFYSQMMDQKLPTQIEQKFKSITKEIFDLDKSII